MNRTRRSFLRESAIASGGATLALLCGSCSSGGACRSGAVRKNAAGEVDFKALHRLYRSELLDRVIPFWTRHGVDWEKGGICTCLSDEGRVVSRDKYMWSQLRALWTFSTLYNKIERRREWLEIAQNIFTFARKYGRDSRGHWVFSVSENGQPLKGATSIYADAFAISGLAAYAKASGDGEAVRLARETCENVRRRLDQPGSYPTEPLPIPVGAKAHGIAMIFGMVFFEFGQSVDDPEMIRAGLDLADQVMRVFLRPERRRLYEFVKLDNTLLEDPPGRTVVPGHAIESMWFVLHMCRQTNDPARIRQAVESIRWHLELGWDTEYGGLYMARDAEGSFWADKWDTKVWWPHTEALYALLLAHSLTREPWCMEWYQKVHDYAFCRFPVPRYGEWYQRLDRAGKKIGNLSLMPVKDPYHLARALIYGTCVLEGLAADSRCLTEG